MIIRIGFFLHKINFATSPVYTNFEDSGSYKMRNL